MDIILAGMTRAFAAVVLSTVAMLPACRPQATPAKHGSARPPVAGTHAAMVRKATVVAFWLRSSDTLPERELTKAREAFRRSNQMLADYLDDTDVTLVATVQDTVLIRLEGGGTRVVMLSGLDYPYGYVFIDPGYAEEFHAGPSTDDDLKDALDDYFDLHEDDSTSPTRIASAMSLAQGTPSQSGPRETGAGLAPVTLGIPSHYVSAASFR